MEISKETRDRLLADLSQDELQAELERRNRPQNGDIVLWEITSRGACGLRLEIYESRGLCLKNFDDIIRAPYYPGHSVRDLGQGLIDLADKMGW